MIKSNIDLILSSAKIADKIDVEILSETWGSDHFPIKILLDSEKHPYEKKSFKIKTKRTNWNMFNEELEKKYDEFLSAEYEALDPTLKFEKFVKTVIETLRASTPVKKKINAKTKKIHNPVLWWNSECDRVK